MRVKIGDFKTEPEQKEDISDILKSNKVTEGRFVKSFEKRVEDFLEVKHAIAVTNGTVSLQLIAQYIKYKIKKEKPVVCVPAMTFPATLNAFLITGFEPILCDIEEETLCINIDKLSEEEKQKIDVIVPVSLLGYTPNMDKIMLEAEKYNWLVVEDFAEAFGSIYKGKRLGNIGHFGSSSFFVSHVIQGGELGVVTTNDDEAAEIMRKMKCHGRDGDPLLFNHAFIGSNYKTNEFCAALANDQMKHAKNIIRLRQEIAKIYFDNITSENVKAMPISEDFSFLGYPLLVLKGRKDDLCRLLNYHDIETRGIFPCLANQKAYEGMFDSTKYPIANKIEKIGFYIGVHQYISKEDALEIAILINEWKP